jgi:DNA-binding CsgD family transcriptional regulator
MRFTMGGSEYAVLAGPCPAALDVLSEAERQVILLALAGMSNVEIAGDRRTAPRTVANQLARAYRKLGVCSRAELAAKLG